MADAVVVTVAVVVEVGVAGSGVSVTVAVSVAVGVGLAVGVAVAVGSVRCGAPKAGTWRYPSCETVSGMAGKKGVMERNDASKRTTIGWELKTDSHVSPRFACGQPSLSPVPKARVG